MTIHERFSYFVKSCYSNIENFAQEIGDKKENIYRYQNSSSVPTHTRLIKFQEAGMSIDWLLTGIGIMFARNAKGMDLQKEYENENETKGTLPFERIKQWIERNFNSLSEFSVLMNIDHDNLHMTLFNEFAMDTNIIRLIQRCGCNIDWAKSGVGDQYSNTPMGEILRTKRAQMFEELKDLEIEHYPAVYYYGKDQSEQIEKVIDGLVQKKLNKKNQENNQ